MQVFKMFSEIPENYSILYPDGTIKTKAEVKKDYPILGTPMGVIGFTTDSTGAVTNPVLMGYYDNINSFVDCYVSQGAQVTSDMTPAQKCAAITEFVANPVSEADEAVEAYLAL